jgi:hypothetical protein
MRPDEEKTPKEVCHAMNKRTTGLEDGQDTRIIRSFLFGGARCQIPRLAALPLNDRHWECPTGG